MSNQNILPWSKDYFLDWSDFRAESNPAVFEDAYSVIKYRFTWTLNSESFGSKISFSIKNVQLSPEFHRQLSWVRTSMATLKLLNHQQGHFDLAELLRDEITKKIKDTIENKLYPTRGQNEEQQKQFAREDSGTMIAKELEKGEKYLSEKQKEYDALTDYGQIESKQAEYDVVFSKLHR
ncbi:MAG: hypothetical protein OEL69_04745 [Nitrosopumilus sp.]|nr:hypothetical protein [Nitrosopumilus sp.]